MCYTPSWRTPMTSIDDEARPPPGQNTMTAKSSTGTAAENSSETESGETVREAFEKAIAGNPRFKEASKSGKAFVVTGAKWPSETS